MSALQIKGNNCSQHQAHIAIAHTHTHTCVLSVANVAYAQCAGEI